MWTNSESPGAEPGASSESSSNPTTSCVNALNESNNAKKKGKTLQVPDNYNDESFYTQSFDSDYNENNQDDVARQINQTNAKSLAATQNMVAMMEEGRDAGYRTQANLYKQGEKLKGVEKDMDRMGEAMDLAEDELDEMEGKGGCCGMRRKKKRKGAAGYAEGKKKGKKFKYTTVANGNFEEQQRNGGNFKYVTGDAQEQQMADNLDLVDDILDEMDYLADDLNTEIKTQNKRLDRLQTKGQDHRAQQDRLNEKATRVATGKGPDNSGGGNVVTKAMGF